jgi:hypothetical protein
MAENRLTTISNGTRLTSDRKCLAWVIETFWLIKLSYRILDSQRDLELEGSKGEVGILTKV